MITERFTLEEINKAVNEIRIDLAMRLNDFSKKYFRDFNTRRNILSYPFVYAKHETIYLNKNKYVGFFGSPDKLRSSFALQIYLILDTSHGKRYYKIGKDLKVSNLSKHMIQRFIERSNYPVNKDNFLVYFAKDTMGSHSVFKDGDIEFIRTNSGMMVYKEQTYITYLNGHDLSSYKECINTNLKERENLVTPEQRKKINEKLLKKFLNM